VVFTKFISLSYKFKNEYTNFETLIVSSGHEIEKNWMDGRTLYGQGNTML